MSDWSNPEAADREHNEPPPPRRSGLPVWAVLLIVGGILMVVGLPCIAIVAAIAIPNLLASKVAADETATVMNLKALSTAQEQYNKQTDTFAASAQELARHGWIDSQLANAFEGNQGNADSPAPVPHAGYFFLMLQGDSPTAPTNFWTNPADPTAGMTTWAATARAVAPGDTGEHQFFISEQGTVFKRDEAPVHNPLYLHFYLNASIPNNSLASLTSWTPTR
ncbi:MAG: hypothetical protein ACREJ2_18315 [Planctomycetota bacterium]